MADLTAEVSKKLNVVIALLLHSAVKDEESNAGRRKIGDLAAYLRRYDMDYAEIAVILDSPVASFRELVRLKKRRKK